MKERNKVKIIELYHVRVGRSLRWVALDTLTGNVVVARNTRNLLAGILNLDLKGGEFDFERKGRFSLPDFLEVARKDSRFSRFDLEKPLTSWEKGKEYKLLN